MGYASRSPRPGPLDQVVERLWWCEIDEAGGSETVLPTGRSQVVLGLDPSAPRALVQGPLATGRTVDATLQRRAVGVAFRPGGLAAIVGDEVDQLTDRMVDLGAVWGATGAELHDRLGETTTAAQAFATIEASLLRALDASPPTALDHLVVAAEGLLRAGQPVGSVVATLGVDRRPLAARFERRMGLGLKTYQRLTRFERTLVALRRVDAPPIGVLAAELGFADQAHLTREVRALAGTTPAALHRDGAASPTHLVPDHGRR